jgi:tetratricopeptide (TPR) repeat protein
VRKLYFSTLFLLSNVAMFCQADPLLKGDVLMRGGAFATAAVYFDSLCRKDPDNRTYALLLARSLGLSGNHQLSATIMDSVLKIDPEDKSWQMSRAELWLWQKNAPEAVKLLQPLYNRDSANEGILYTYCNALIAAGQFTAGLPVLEKVKWKAGGKQPYPDMQKNLRIGYALQLRASERYQEAVMQTDSILLAMPLDPGTMLLRGDLLLQGKRYGDAVKNYAQIVPLNFEKTTVLINMSYALFMKHKPGMALGKAKEALESAAPASKMAVINYFNALLWNLKINEARKFLLKNQQRLLPAELLVLKARLYTSGGHYKEGLIFYDSLVKTYPGKYYFQEYAEVMLGKKEYKAATDTMRTNRQLFSASEYTAWEQKVKGNQLQHAGIELVYFKDVGKNVRTEEAIFWNQGEGKKLKLFFKVGHVNVSQAAAGEKTSVNYFSTQVNERISKTWSGQTELYLQQIKPAKASAQMAVTGRQLFQYTPTDRFMASLFYQSSLFNFTASLLEKNIQSQDIGYITNYMFTSRMGVYSQGSGGFLNDGNKKTQVFASLYYLLRTEPTIKTGINLSTLHYADSSIKSYFAPNSYSTGEVFADYSTALPTMANFYFQGQVAKGLQQIEKRKLEPTFRLQLETGYRRKHIEASLKYQTSNVASANGAGYKFNWFTLRCMYKW